jgi:hypothetical protein
VSSTLIAIIAVSAIALGVIAFVARGSGPRVTQIETRRDDDGTGE